MINLFVAFYRETHAPRDAELRACLRRNLDVPFIDRVFILNEGGELGDLAGAAKVTVRCATQRPSYRDFFAWVNEVTGEADLNLIANTDIYFDPALAALASYPMAGRCLALSRWDVQPDGSATLFRLDRSQDAWIFRGPIRPVEGDFPLGLRGCDGRIAYELKRAGYRVLNPCFTLKTYHLQLSNYRTYEQTSVRCEVPPPYAAVPQRNLLPLWRHVWQRRIRGAAALPYEWDLGLRLRRRLETTRVAVGAGMWRARGRLRCAPGGEWLRRTLGPRLAPWAPAAVPSVAEVLGQLVAATPRPWTFIHVGAHDGVTDDPLHPWVASRGWRGVMVEPVASAFVQLQANGAQWHGVVFRHAAVAASDGPVTLHYHDAGHAYSRLSTLKREVLAWYRYEQIPDIEKDLKTATVAGLTLNRLITEAGFVPDLVRLDAVGREYDILRAFDLAAARPKVWLISARHLRENYRRLFKRLRAWGYVVFKDADNALAVDRAFWGVAGDRPARPVVLYVCPHPICPPEGGGALRCFHLLSQLAGAYEVHAVIFQDKLSLRAGHGGYRLPESVRLYSPVDDPPPATFWDRLPFGASLHYRWLCRTWRGPADAVVLRAHRLVAEVLRAHRPAAVLFQHLQSLRLAPIVKRLAPDAVRILDAANVEQVLAAQRVQQALAAGRPAAGSRKTLQAVAWMERHLGRFAHAFLACSREDWDLLARASGVAGAVLPNGVDTERLRPPAAGAAGAPADRLLFCGTLSYEPNRDGLTWFLAEVWPRILAHRPGATLTVVGRGAQPADVAAWQAAPGVRVVGAVPEVLPFYAEAGIAVCPLRMGSGTRLKILEAMSAGIPVVSTTLGAEGLSCEADRHLVIADRPDAFAQAVCRLIEDDQQRMAISAEARKLVMERYDWKVIGAEWRRELARVIAAYRAVEGTP